MRDRQARRPDSCRRMWVGLVAAAAFAPSWGQSLEIRPNPRSYLSQSQVAPELRQVLTPHLERLARPGKERVAFGGTLTQASGRSNLRVVVELPDKFRIDETGAPNGLSVSSNGRAPNSARALSDEANDIIESLVADTADYFLYSTGLSATHIGRRFRQVDGLSSGIPPVTELSQPYNGPLYDMYLWMGPITVRSTPASRQKLYRFDSATGLLDLVQYVVNRAGREATVTTMVSGWQVDRDGVASPGRIERREDGRVIMTLDSIAASSGPKANDGIFERP